MPSGHLGCVRDALAILETISGSVALAVALADTSTVHDLESGIALWVFQRLAFSIEVFEPAATAWLAYNTLPILELRASRAPGTDGGDTVPLIIEHCRSFTRRTFRRNAFGTVKIFAIVTFRRRVDHTVFTMLHPLFTDRGSAHHTFIMAIPSTTANARRRNDTDTRVAFQFGV